MSDHDRDDGDSTVLDRPPVHERERQDLVPPPKYAVVLLNDDFTPMDFVVSVLQQLFSKGSREAEAIMMDVHNTGKGLAGTYSKEVAETKVAQVIQVSQHYGHPFRAQMEPLH